MTTGSQSSAEIVAGLRATIAETGSTRLAPEGRTMQTVEETTQAYRGPSAAARGFTLVELVIALAIMGLLLAGIFYSFGIQNEKYVLVDQVTEAQQNLRGSAELIEREIRRAGYLIPGAAAFCMHDRTDRPDSIFIADAEAIRGIDDLKANAPELLNGDLGVEIVARTATTVTLPGGASPQLKIDVGATVGFEPNGGVILIDRNDPEHRVACGQISKIETDVMTVDFGTSAYATSIGSSDVVAVPAAAYTIMAATSTDPSQLLRNGRVVAYDVEDIQAAVFFDENGNGVRDTADEVFGAAAGKGPYPPVPGADFDMGTLREVEVSIITVTRDDAPNSTAAADSISQGQRTANRATGLAAPDRRSRRVHRSTVGLRNLG